MILALPMCAKRLWAVTTALFLLGGCSLVPQRQVVGRIHNPFPQLHTIAVLPFFNQSENPNVDGEATANAYYGELQAVAGFEVLPVGVTLNGLRQFVRRFGEPTGGPEFQALARFLGVDAIVVGSVTDFDAFYPPRMAMTTRWYAANESFHEIPPGYGLPWGTDAEQHIPGRVVDEAEFALARKQLATQTPPPIVAVTPSPPVQQRAAQAIPVPHATRAVPNQIDPVQIGPPGGPPVDGIEYLPPAPRDIFAQTERWVDAPPTLDLTFDDSPAGAGSPPHSTPPHSAKPWPDPTGFIPDPPSIAASAVVANHDAILSHTRIYRGDDAYLTNRLADYVETADDARPSGWQGYLRRSDDFVRFCCHLHITEMLESRGGRGQSDLIVRWPVSRY